MASFRFSRASAPQRFAAESRRAALPAALQLLDVPGAGTEGDESGQADTADGIDGLHLQEVDASALSLELREALGLN